MAKRTVLCAPRCKPFVTGCSRPRESEGQHATLLPLSWHDGQAARRGQLWLPDRLLPDRLAADVLQVQVGLPDAEGACQAGPAAAKCTSRCAASAGNSLSGRPGLAGCKDQPVQTTAVVESRRASSSEALDASQPAITCTQRQAGPQGWHAALVSRWQGVGRHVQTKWLYTTTCCSG